MLVIWSAASKNNIERHPDRQPSVIPWRRKKVIWGFGLGYAAQQKAL